MKTEQRQPKPYPAFRRLVDRSGLAAFLSSNARWPAFWDTWALGQMSQMAATIRNDLKELPVSLRHLGQLRHPGRDTGHCPLHHRGLLPAMESFSNRNRQIEAKAPHQPEPADQRGTENGQLATYIYVDTRKAGRRRIRGEPLGRRRATGSATK